MSIRRIEIFKRSRAKSARVGIAIQAYLFRTPKDIEAMIPLGPAIRIVKGAYLEPPDIAYPKKSDVDEAFYTLCTRLMAADAQKSRDAAAHRDARHPARGSAAGLHQTAQRPEVGLRVRDALRHPAPAAAAPGPEGQRLRVLISYGEYWFPWYMRRLAERPGQCVVCHPDDVWVTASSVRPPASGFKPEVRRKNKLEAGSWQLEARS